MLKDLAARWLCKDDVLKNHVGRAFLPASYLATTNGRPTIPFNTQSHVGRASCPPLDPGDHEWSPYNRIKASCPSRAGIPARLDPGDHEWSPYNPVQHLSPCRAGIPARLDPSDYEWLPYNPVQYLSPCRPGILPASYLASTNGRHT